MTVLMESGKKMKGGRISRGKQPTCWELWRKSWGVTSGFSFPFPAAPRSWWSSPTRAAQASATGPESTWGFSQATSQPWFKAFWSEWWTDLHPTNPCAWRPSVRPVSPLHKPSAEVAPTSSLQLPSPPQPADGLGLGLHCRQLTLLGQWATQACALQTVLSQVAGQQKGVLLWDYRPNTRGWKAFPIHSFVYLATF